jgi:AcrR family transcriptional regulator
MSRRARSEQAILNAALDLMAEHGVSGLTVDAVAARAGVGKQTIYRHWGSRARLVHDAIACTNDAIEQPDTGSLRGDLEALLGQVARFLANPASGGVFPSLLEAAERDPELAGLRAEHSEQKRAAFVVVLQRAAARGELADGVDVQAAVDLVVGPLFYRRLVAKGALGPKTLQRHLDLVLRALLAEVEHPVEVDA